MLPVCMHPAYSQHTVVIKRCYESLRQIHTGWVRFDCQRRKNAALLEVGSGRICRRELRSLGVPFGVGGTLSALRRIRALAVDVGGRVGYLYPVGGKRLENDETACRQHGCLETRVRGEPSPAAGDN